MLTQEGFTLHEDAAGMIARLSDGGMRDALSLLDQCVAYENDITLDVVSQLPALQDVIIFLIFSKR